MGRPFVEVVLVIQAEAHAVADPAAAPGPLTGGRLGDLLDLQLLHLVAVGITLEPGQAGIHHVADARHGEGGLGHVGGQHHPAPLGRGKDPGLILGRLAGEQGQDLGAGGVVGLAQGLGGFTDLPLAGQEHQHVAGAAAVGLVHRIHQGIVEVPVRAAVVLAWRGFAGANGLGFIPLHRPVTHLDGEEAAGHLDHRGGRVAAAKVAGETLGVQGGGGHDELHVRPLLQ